MAPDLRRQQQIFVESKFAIVETTQRVRAVLNAGQPAGTGFPVRVMHLHLQRLIAARGLARKGEYAAWLIIGTTVMSALGEQLSQISNVDLLRHSVSCSRVHGMTTLHTNCGSCSQCLDRRFETLSAGLEDDDPADMYRVDLLAGGRQYGEECTMAEAFVRRAPEFRRMTEIGFVGQCAGEVSRRPRASRA